MHKFYITLIGLLTSFSLLAQERVEGQLIWQLEQKASVEKIIKQFNEHSVSSTISLNKPLADFWNIYLIDVQNGRDEDVLEQLWSLSATKAIQFNRYVDLRATIPNDTLFGTQWNMRNVGQTQGQSGADISATEAWDIATGGVTANGDTIVVAVVDGGCDLNHVDLDFWKNKDEIPGDSIDNDNNGYIDDYHGWNAWKNTPNIPGDYHGTHVAGIIGARGNDTTGVAGVNWNVKLLPVVVWEYTEAEVVAAFAYVYTLRKRYNDTDGAEGAFIVASNNSFGVDNALPVDYPLWCGMYDSLGSIGVLSIGATTNFGADIDVEGDVPTGCSSDYLITVTNTNSVDVKNPSSGFGLTSIDLGAPGTSVRSTTPNDLYGNSTGTSMSAPHVAGAVALMFNAGCDSFMADYNRNPQGVLIRMKEIIIEEVDLLPSLTGISVSGGRLNLFKSLQGLINEYCVECVELDVTKVDVTCYGAENGLIGLGITSGTPPYYISWSTGDTVVDQLSSLAPGRYSVSVSDSLRCSKFANVMITQPDEILTSYIITDAIDGTPTGSAKSLIVGGVPPYTYNWSNGSDSSELINASTGWYWVTVTDDQGCQQVDSLFVDNIVGVGEPSGIAELEVTVFPNPFSSQFTLLINSTIDENLSVTILDVLGRSSSLELIMNPAENSSLIIDGSTFSKGVYLLNIQSDSGARTTRQLVRY